MQAKAHYEAILALNPRHFDALHLLGIVAAQTQNPQEAERLISRALQVNPYAAIALLALAAGCNSVAAVSSWALPNDLSERHSGTLAGVLNTATNLGGALSPVLTPYLAARFGWIAALDFAAAFMFSIALLWLLVHPQRKID